MLLWKVERFLKTVSKQQFKMDNGGFIICKSNPNLVLGTEKGKKIQSGSEICIQNKSHDEPGQLWKKSEKSIHLVFDDSLVMAVKSGKLVLEVKCNTSTGVANQRFSVDKYGGIRGFDAEEMDVEGKV